MIRIFFMSIILLKGCFVPVAKAQNNKRYVSATSQAVVRVVDIMEWHMGKCFSLNRDFEIDCTTHQKISDLSLKTWKELLVQGQYQP